ncbi:MAG: hypothetical protein KCHDKBKB_02460 [Elusimicrobia bacterium]|nr:hypothetical protein [Elusimicrobiota bacterium]MCG3205737.1 hypothetical protein [Elusimicrobiota bacterium]
MEPASMIAIITAAIPFVTAAAKRILKTDTWGERKRGWNALLPILIGVVSAGVYAHSQGSDWVTSLAIGLGSGGVASSARDIDKNLIHLARAILESMKKTKPVS